MGKSRSEALRLASCQNSRESRMPRVGWGGVGSRTGVGDKPREEQGDNRIRP